MKKIFTVIILLIGSLVFAQENYRIKNLDVNTETSDFGTSYLGEDILFSSNGLHNNKSVKHWTNGQRFLDIYKGTISSNGEIINVKLFNDIVTKYHESNAIYTKDGKTAYFTRNNYLDKIYGKDSLGWNNLKLYKAEIDEQGKWVNIQSLPFNNDNFSVGHPALSPDEKTLYFTSDMPGSMGQTDIFKTSINNDGTYGVPVNLGMQINTHGKEMFPFVSASNNLYYSSDGRGSTGGLDIYVVPMDYTNITPQNLGSPINSPKDDFCFIIDENKKNGYFSSNRGGGKGDDDIYYFDELKAPKFSCNQVVVGVVKDKETGVLLPNSVVSLHKNNQKITEMIVSKDAKYRFENLDCDATYLIKGIKENYDENQQIINTTKVADFVLDVEIALNPHKVEVAKIDECQKELNSINTIYFDLDKYAIRPDAAVELDKIVAVLNKCSGVKVEAKSYTDSRASNAYNVTLSQNRVQSTVDYIISKGVVKDRIAAKGYGENQLVNHCSDGVNCSEAEHQQNRRTEFIILK